MSIGTKTFILVFFLSLACLLSCKIWRMGESTKPLQANGRGCSDGVRKFLTMLEDRPFGPYAFTNQSRHSILTSLFESVNAELVKAGEKYGISESHPGSCFNYFCTNVYIPAMPVAQLYSTLARQWGYTFSNSHGFFVLDERRGGDGFPVCETRGGGKNVGSPVPVFVAAQNLEHSGSDDSDEVRERVKKFLTLLEVQPFGPYTFTNQYRGEVLMSLFIAINEQLAERGEPYAISGGYGTLEERFCTNVYLPEMPPVKMVERLAREWNCAWTNKNGFFDLDERSEPGDNSPCQDSGHTK